MATPAGNSPSSPTLVEATANGRQRILGVSAIIVVAQFFFYLLALDNGQAIPGNWG